MINIYSVTVALYGDYPCEEFVSQAFASEDEALAYAEKEVRRLLGEYNHEYIPTAIAEMRSTLEQYNHWSFDIVNSDYCQLDVLITKSLIDYHDRVTYSWGHQIARKNWVIDAERNARFTPLFKAVESLRPNGWDHAVFKKTEDGREFIVLCGSRDSDEGRYINVTWTSVDYATALVFRCAFDE